LASASMTPGEQLCAMVKEQVSARELAEAMVQAVSRLAKDGRADRERSRSTL
jgi:thymidylate synthase ThyX